MPQTLVLMASPLLGPAVWSPVDDELAAHGWTVLVPPQPAAAPRSADDLIRHLLDHLPTDRDLILTPHSNAGLYVPALTQCRRITGCVFVDARVPPARGEVGVTPPGFAEKMAARAEADGALPQWTRWWDEDDVAALFPDDDTRRRVEQQQMRLSLSFLRSTVTVAAGWDAMHGAYLAFGDTYDHDRRAAARRGWPIRTMAGNHLHMMTDPHAVAAAITELLRTFPAHNH